MTEWYKEDEFTQKTKDESRPLNFNLRFKRSSMIETRHEKINGN